MTVEDGTRTALTGHLALGDEMLPKTSVTDYVTSQKSEDLIYTAEKA
jgi:hypothetical protein